MENKDRAKSKNKISFKNSDSVRIWACALLGGLFFGVTYHWGRQLDAQGYVNFAALSTWLWILGTAAAVTPVLAWLFGKKPKLQKGCGSFACANAAVWKNDKAGEEQGAVKSAGLTVRCRWLLTALGLFLAWLPVFAAVYPGFFAYDATDELQEVLTGQYVTRHPLLHVQLLGKTVSGIGRLSGSYNAGIAVYVLVQMMVMALLLSWVLQCGRRFGAGRLWYGVSFLFLALFPVIPMYVMCTSKDILYTAGMLAAIALLGLMRAEPEECCRDIKKWIGLGAALFVMAVFRNNGFYVFLVMIPVLCMLAQKKYRRRMLAVIVLVLAARAGMNCGLNAVLKPVSTDVQETFTVPIQQLARTWNYSPEVFEEADREALFEILPEEVLERYYPKLSDMVKIDFNAENYEKDPKRYQSLWLRTGAKAPLTYVNAWLMTSYGFWYPFTVIDVYNGTRYYEGSSYFSCETEAPGERRSFLPGLEKLYEEISWGSEIHRLPVVSWLFSPGFLCWVYVLAGLYWAARGSWERLGVMLPVYLNWLTVLFGPTYLVRYVLIFWFALPLLAAMRVRTSGD